MVFAWNLLVVLGVAYCCWWAASHFWISEEFLVVGWRGMRYWNTSGLYNVL